MDTGVYGFRQDPMEWAASADSLDGARVRTHVLQQPNPGDSAIIEEEIQRIFSSQNPEHELWRLLDLECPTERPEFQKAFKTMLDSDDPLEAYNLNIACRAGWENTDALKGAMVKTQTQVESLNFWEACPWHGQNFLQILWAGRQHHDVIATVERGLTIMRDHLTDERYWPMYLDPFGWLECTGYIDHPIAEEIVLKMIPMILRAQDEDGSWGGEDHMGYGPGSHTFAAFRALYKWGLIEQLRSKPPLPPEWTLMKTIPAPRGELCTMAWDSSRLWVYDKTTSHAVAISPEEGTVLHSVKMPDNTYGIAWSNGSLLASRIEPEALFYIDPDTGAVQREITPPSEVWGMFSAIAELDHRICIGNHMCSGVHFLTENRISKHIQWLAGASVIDMVCVNNQIWHIDAFSRLLILSDPSDPTQPAALVDWATAPFGQNTAGLTWDGERLWALDAAKHRISRIERIPKQLGKPPV